MGPGFLSKNPEIRAPLPGLHAFDPTSCHLRVLSEAGVRSIVFRPTNDFACPPSGNAFQSRHGPGGGEACASRSLSSCGNRMRPLASNGRRRFKNTISHENRSCFRQQLPRPLSSGMRHTGAGGCHSVANAASLPRGRSDFDPDTGPRIQRSYPYAEERKSAHHSQSLS